jgi:hypothetical protein
MSRPSSISSWSTESLDIAWSEERDRPYTNGFGPRVSESYLCSTAPYPRPRVLRGRVQDHIGAGQELIRAGCLNDVRRAS